MSDTIQCPSCRSLIPAGRILKHSVICECGWTYSRREVVEKERFSSHLVIAQLIVIGVFISMSLTHFAKWGSHSLDVLPLIGAQLTGKTTQKQLSDLSDICKEQGNIQCRISTLAILAGKYSRLEARAELGHLYFLQGNDKKSSQVLKLYFKKGGKHHQAKYDLARALGHLGEVEKSTHHFRILFKERPNSLQITVMRSYVSMLVKNKKFQEAKIVINELRKNNGVEFALARELQIIESEILAQL